MSRRREPDVNDDTGGAWMFWVGLVVVVWCLRWLFGQADRTK